MEKKQEKDVASNAEAALSAAMSVFDSVRDQLYSRAKSPLVGAFVIAWTAINFRAIYALLISDTYADAFRIIDAKVWYDLQSSILFGIVLPATAAFSYLFAVPKLERVAVKFWVRGKLEVRKERLLQEGEAPLEKVSADLYHEKIRALEAQFRTDIATMIDVHNKELAEAKQGYDGMRQRWAQSFVSEDEIKNVLYNMSEDVRDVLWASRKIQRSLGDHVGEEAVSEFLKSMKKELSPRDIGRAFHHLSMFGLTQDELSGPFAGRTIRLSIRGRNLAERMEAAGFAPSDKK